MTKEEAIEVISQDIPCEHDADLIEALKMAIKALEQEPCREIEDYENEIEDLHNRLDIAEYDKERLREEVTNLEEKIKALEQEPKTEQFAQWVAEEVIDEELWELNYGAFAELACRKLEKLGIVRAKGDEWELVEPQESEE